MCVFQENIVNVLPSYKDIATHLNKNEIEFHLRVLGTQGCLTLSRFVKRQVLTNSMAAILTFWSTTASDDVMADPVALLSITITHSGARFWPQKEKPQPQLFCHFFLFLLFFALAGLPDQNLQNMSNSKPKLANRRFFQ